MTVLVPLVEDLLVLRREENEARSSVLRFCYLGLEKAGQKECVFTQPAEPQTAARAVLNKLGPKHKASAVFFLCYRRVSLT